MLNKPIDIEQNMREEKIETTVRLQLYCCVQDVERMRSDNDLLYTFEE